MATSPSSVSALAQQFEQTAKREWAEAQRSQSRSTSRAGSRPASAMDGNRQIVVVSKPTGEMQRRVSTNVCYSGYKSRKDYAEMIEHERAIRIHEEIEESTRVRTIERPAYTPSDERTILSTTVVDIDPTRQDSQCESVSLAEEPVVLTAETSCTRWSSRPSAPLRPTPTR